MRAKGKRKPKRRLPVLEPSAPIQCDRLRATLSYATCVKRHALSRPQGAQRRGPAERGYTDPSLTYLSCRDCPEGAARSRGEL